MVHNKVGGNAGFWYSGLRLLTLFQMPLLKGSFRNPPLKPILFSFDPSYKAIFFMPPPLLKSHQPPTSEEMNGLLCSFIVLKLLGWCCHPVLSDKWVLQSSYKKSKIMVMQSFFFLFGRRLNTGLCENGKSKID